MTGCLHVKNGKYYIVLSYTENGKRQRPWIATGLPEKGNKRKAEQMLREKIREYELKAGRVQSDILFSTYIRHWLMLAQKKVDAVTFQGYDSLAQRHILPYFDQLGTRLQDVDLPILQRYLDEKSTCGRLDGNGGLSPRSIKLHRNIIQQTLDEAVKNKLLPDNPCRFLIMPKQQRHEAHFYSAEQLQQLFEAIQDEPLFPLIKITAFYGLRRSEVLGLKWDSIDFDAGTLTIKHTVSKVTHVVEKDKTKNASSYRSFPLSQEARRIFQNAKQAAQENCRLFGGAYHKSEYVFTWPDGHPFSPDYVTDKFSSLLKKYGFPHIRFHELRHSCASLLINSGFNLKDVQEWLGHSDIKMTANIYGHLDVKRKETMAAQLSSALI